LQRAGERPAARRIPAPRESTAALGNEILRRAVSKQNVEFVGQLWDAVDKSGVEAALELTEPDVEWSFYRAGRILSSRDLLDFLEEFQGERQLVDATAYSIDAYGDYVLASGSFRLTGSQGLSEFQIHIVYEFSDGKLVRAESYPSLKEAREALGLPEAQAG
jgi:ketosteroid isomerase-like protein